MEKYEVPLQTPCVYFDEGFLTQQEADDAYETLLKSTAWEKTSKINRYVALHEEEIDDDQDTTTTTTTAKPYKYRDAPGAALSSTEEEQRKKLPFTETIRSICNKAENWYNNNNNSSSSSSSTKNSTSSVKFNVCLLNYYEDGSNRIGWHCDREEIGRDTPIASISLGATREFQIRAKEGLERTKISLTNGSIVIMENICQVKYLHCLPKMMDVTKGRVNLTFRCKTGADTPGEEEHERRDLWLERIIRNQHQNNEDNGGEGATTAAEFGDSYPNYALMASSNKKTGEGGVDIDADNSNTPVFGDVYETQEELSTKLEAMEVLYTIKTNIGAEDYASAEVSELLNNINNDNNNTGTTTTTTHQWNTVPRPWGVAGYVAVGRSTRIRQTNKTTIQQATDDSDDKVLTAEKTLASSLLLKLQSALFVMQYHDHFNLAEVSAASDIEVAEIGGEDLYQFYKKRLADKTAIIPTLEQQQQQQHPLPVEDNGNSDTKPSKKASNNKKTTFRVTCERIGNHKFQAPNVEFEIGGAMSEYFQDNVKPKMEDFDANVRVDVIGSHVIVGTQLNFVDLTKRHFLRYRNKVTIKTNLAYIMLRCAGVLENQVVLDPFCGSGTILLEAMEMQPSVRCIGLDVNRRSVQGAKDNAEAASSVAAAKNQCRFHCVDARGMRRYVAERSVDCIVSNLPWGVQTAQKTSVTDLQSLYEQFLRTSWYVLKDRGRIVMLVLRGLQLTRILRKLGGRFRILRANVIRTSNNLPCLVVAEKIPRDLLNDAIKGQLAFVAQYVNVSREMYHAIHNEDIATGLDVPEPASRQSKNEEEEGLAT